MSRKAPSGGLHPEITLPHSEAWELYHNSFSLCSKKLRVCIAELGLPYRSHHIDLIETGSYQNVSHDYLKINPGGTVPVLVHNGHPIYESHDEIIYAAKHAGEHGKELLPEDPETRALVDHWSDCASIVGNAIQGTEHRAGHCIPALTLPLFATMVGYIPYREIFRGLLTHPYKERPLLFALLKSCGVHRIPSLTPMMKMLRQALSHMGSHLDSLAELLDSHGGPWIAGAHFTLADVSWVVILDRIVEADWENYFWGDDKRPTIAAYWERLHTRPSYATEIVEARCSNTLKGIANLKKAKSDDDQLTRSLEGA